MINDPALLVVDKPQGLTSSDLTLQVKKKMSYSKVGHGGTLDPFATGLLPIFIGPYTKLASLFHQADKEYSATLKLGEKTDTADYTGQVLKKGPVRPLNPMQVQLLSRSLLGQITLRVPNYSARKIDGKPMYKLAREGKLKPQDHQYQKVTIHELSIEKINDQTLKICAKVSSGTYIRALGELIAHKLGTVGHLTQLHRQAYFLPTGLTLKEGAQLNSLSEKSNLHSYSIEQLSAFIPTLRLKRTLYRDFQLGALHYFPLRSTGWHIVVKQDSSPLGFIFLEKGCVKNRIILKA